MDALRLRLRAIGEHVPEVGKLHVAILLHQLRDVVAAAPAAGLAFDGDGRDAEVGEVEIVAGHVVAVFSLNCMQSALKVATTMFVRARKSKSKIRLSLVGTQRVGGKVRHEHIASLGSLPLAMAVVDRREFWRRLEPRLAALGNRIDLEAARALIAATVSPPTKAEIDILDLEEYAAAWEQLGGFLRAAA
jgi:hypothetical protein